jgi:hypothetical protein
VPGDPGLLTDDVLDHQSSEHGEVVMSMPNTGPWSPDPFGLTPGPRPDSSGPEATLCALRPPRRFAPPPGFPHCPWPLVAALLVEWLHPVRFG